MILIRLTLVSGIFVLAVWLYGCEETSCVAEGTLIATPDGVTLVEALRVGDTVLSMNPTTGQTYPARITVIRSTKRECLPLTSGNGSTLWLTAEHPVYDPDSKSYRIAGDWLKDSALSVLTVGSDGFIIQGATASNLQTKHAIVFDISVDSPHKNFRANGILVHNKPPLPLPPPDISGEYIGCIICTLENDTIAVFLTDSLPVQVSFQTTNPGVNGEFSMSPYAPLLDTIPPEPCFWGNGIWFQSDRAITLLPLDSATPLIFDTVICMQSTVPILLVIVSDTIVFSINQISSGDPIDPAGDTLHLAQFLPMQNLSVDLRLVARPEI